MLDPELSPCSKQSICINGCGKNFCVRGVVTILKHIKPWRAVFGSKTSP